MEKHPQHRLSYASPDDGPLKKAVINAVELATGRKRLERLYQEVKADAPATTAIWKAVLDKLKVSLSYNEAALSAVPSSGPLVFVANHPFGVLDGLILGHLASQVRPEFYVLVNEVLTREPTLKRHLLPIDFRETKAAARTNLETRSSAMERLKAGAAIAIFPAGGVATAPPQFWRPARDFEWKRFSAKLIAFSQATVVPVYFHGQNSRLFQAASQISMNLRLSLLLYEVHNKIGTTIRLTIGSPIPYTELSGMARQDLLDELRRRTEQLALSR